MIEDSKAKLRTRFCYLVTALLLSAAPSWAAEQVEPRAKGELLYEIYCLNCHGASGKGDGPMARILRVKPANLRLIRSRNGGTFPTEEIHRTIDGRDTVRGHGSEMPLWGLAFRQSNLDTNQEQGVRASIVALTEYLESLQEPAKDRAAKRPRGY